MDHSELIAQFANIVSCEPDRAQFYLEANNWDINAALSNFYEEPPLSSALPSTTNNPPAPLPAEDELFQDPWVAPRTQSDRRRSAASGPIPGGARNIAPTSAPLAMGRTLNDQSEPGVAPVGGPSVMASSTRAPPGSISSGPRIATVASLSNSTSPPAQGAEPRDPQNWFTGGEKSGMMVEAPQDPNENSQVGAAFDMVRGILRKAAGSGPPEGGAPAGSDDDADDDETSFSGRRQAQKAPAPAFKGSGNRLGTQEDSQASSSTVPASTTAAATPSNEVAEDDQTTAVRYLTFYRNGFVIADGPLMRYDDPNNQGHLEAINSGRAPLSLLNVRPGQPVEVRVAKRMEEDYVPPPPKKVPFSGQGQRLGSTLASVTPTVGSSSGSTSATTRAASTPSPIAVDSSQPVTSVQVRLADGSRLVVKLNHTHTVADLRRYILAQRPENASRSFILQTSFPTKTITDESVTLKEANLINSVVVQKLE
ncbi:protein phosphatase regulator [Dimargaris cristalligena]|nr:protein phosphatase regulator [Dimargaris cristalligena]